jgi:hypothetical protein
VIFFIFFMLGYLEGLPLVAASEMFVKEEAICVT